MDAQGLNLKAINAETDRRGFIPVDDHMRVLDKAGKAIPHVFCIGDANGKLMLAHAASAQVVIPSCGKPFVTRLPPVVHDDLALTRCCCMNGDVQVAH